VINSKLGRIYHRFRDMASFPLKNARNGLQSHPKSMIYISFESLYATSY